MFANSGVRTIFGHRNGPWAYAASRLFALLKGRGFRHNGDCDIHWVLIAAPREKGMLRVVSPRKGLQGQPTNLVNNCAVLPDEVDVSIWNCHSCWRRGPFRWSSSILCLANRYIYLPPDLTDVHSGPPAVMSRLFDKDELQLSYEGQDTKKALLVCFSALC